MNFPIALLLLLSAASALLAQTTGTITGAVTDLSGASVANAKVTAVNTSNGEHREVSSSASGQFSFPFLTPGIYRIEASQTGFSTAAASVTLAITERTAVEFILKPSSVTEKIEVTSTAPLLQTESAALGRVVDGTSIKELPLSSRNFTQLLALSPGTSGPLNNAGSLGRGTQNISSGGARLGSNSVYIDGVDSINIHSNTANENAFGSNGLVAPSPEAIQEF